MYGLWKRSSLFLFFPSPSFPHSPPFNADNPSIYPLLAVYGASSATTTWACLATVLTMPGISSEHLVKLLASYVPFLLIPFVMAVDYTLRLTRLAEGGRAIKDKRV
jgi:hypothetical protein